MNGPSNESGYVAAKRTALVAGALVAVVCALLFYDYTRRLVKDPLDSASYKALLAALDQQPTNEALKVQIRELDAQLRREYFRQRAFTDVGAGLLLLFTAVLLIASRMAATLHRRLPSPVVENVAVDREALWTRTARWGVAALCLVLVGAAVLLSRTVRSPLHEEQADVAEASNPSPEAIAETKQANEPSAAPATPPSDEEVAKAWPEFRGPGGSATSYYLNVPDAWDGASGKSVVWKTPVPLVGNNSPIVWGDRVFLSGADKTKREVYCFDAVGGKLLWQKVAPGTPQSTAKPPKVNDETGYAAPTMATDGRRAFAIFANGDLAAFDFAGNVAWSKSLGLPENSYGHASSLAVCKSLLLVQLDQGSSRKTNSMLLAFDSATGNMVWQAERQVPNSWSSPIVIRAADRDQVITTADPWVIAYNAPDGAELWRVKCLKTDIGPSAAFADGRVFVANENAQLSALKADGQGDLTESGVLWTGEDGLPDTCSLLATKDFVFLLTSFGTLTCYDAVKGDMLWAEDFETDFSASPTLVGNRVYLIAKTGKTWIVEPTREKCNRIAEAELGEECVTTPAFQDGRIYLRGKEHLFCLGK